MTPRAFPTAIEKLIALRLAEESGRQLVYARELWRDAQKRDSGADSDERNTQLAHASGLNRGQAVRRLLQAAEILGI